MEFLVINVGAGSRPRTFAGWSRLPHFKLTVPKISISELEIHIFSVKFRNIRRIKLLSGMNDLQTNLKMLARHLSQTHEDILDAWRALAERDAWFTSKNNLNRKQFINDIPRIIDAFCCRLSSWPEDVTPEQRQREHESVKSHSRDRWQMGYNMRALIHEWGHLNSCLLKTLDDYGRERADLQMLVLPEARQIWANLVSNCISQSAVEYHNLLQLEASVRLNHLKTILDHMHELELVRGNNLRTATHALKGSLNILMLSASLINDDTLGPAERKDLCQILTQGVTTLHYMLEELMDMARLEAAQDPISIAAFDAGQVLLELCATSQPLAAARGLLLKADGPANLTIEGDIVKTRRIAQNLLLNALKYTKKGSVSVTWKVHEGKQFLICVKDSGSGLAKNAEVLEVQSHGEGVGLYIV